MKIPNDTPKDAGPAETRQPDAASIEAGIPPANPPDLANRYGVPRSALFGCSGAFFLLCGLSGLAVYVGYRLLA